MPIKKIIFIVIGAIVLLQILVFFRILPGRKAAAPADVEIALWGIQDDGQAWRDILRKFSDKYPYITVKYTRLNEQTYESTLINKIAEGKGPDVFMAKNTWIFKHKDKFYPMPAVPGFSSAQMSEVFADQFANDLVASTGQIFGLPLFMDTLALFYNKDTFNAADIALPPKTWDDAAEISKKLTRKSATDEIISSGLPLGTWSNVDNAFDILSSMMLQYGDPIIAKTPVIHAVLTEKAADAVSLYTSFADVKNPNFSWSARMPDSITAFTETASPFAFGFASDLEKIRAKNSHLNLGIAPFPQQKNARIPIVYGRYFFLAVANASAKKLPAWTFVKFMSLEEGAPLYTEAMNRVPARRDLLALKPKKSEFELFYKQALIARGWPVPDEQAAIQMFGDAIDSINSKSQTVLEAIAALRGRLAQLLP